MTVIDRFVEDREVGEAFAATDAVALPYREILTSGTLFLATGAERPIIIPRLPTLLDVANEDMAFSYRPGDLASLIEALQDFSRASGEELAVMGRRAADHALSHDWHLAGRQFCDIVHGLRARRPHAAFGRLAATDQRLGNDPDYLAMLTRPACHAVD